MNKKSWLIIGVIVLVALGIYFYNSEVGLSPGIKHDKEDVNLLDSYIEGVRPSQKDVQKDVPKLVRIGKSGALSGAQRAMTRGYDACDADLNGDGIVNVNDLILLIADWDTCEGSCVGDITGNGVVDIYDLLILLENWDEICGRGYCGDGYFPCSSDLDCLGYQVCSLQGYCVDDGFEQCDDGNSNNNDGCVDMCVLATCGDGYLWDEEGGSETCDPGMFQACGMMGSCCPAGTDFACRNCYYAGSEEDNCY